MKIRPIQYHFHQTLTLFNIVGTSPPAAVPTYNYKTTVFTVAERQDAVKRLRESQALSEQKKKAKSPSRPNPNSAKNTPSSHESPKDYQDVFDENSEKKAEAGLEKHNMKRRTACDTRVLSQKVR